ncbi:MAG: glycoside hydrolase family 127 protein [Lewinellaceae bacterium]|nr:glycoside hydrolase family 127 protein [Lewinellaceae bacterium]
MLSNPIWSQAPNTNAIKNYSINPVPFTDVRLGDAFWKPRIATVQQVTIPHILQQCEATGRIRNFENAAGTAEGGFCSAFPFDDSDVYKTIEAASCPPGKKNVALVASLDALIAKIAAAQEPDGYLYSWRTIYKAAMRATPGERRLQRPGAQLGGNGTLAENRRPEPRVVQPRPPVRSRRGAPPGHRQTQPAGHCDQKCRPGGQNLRLGKTRKSTRPPGN